MDGYECGTCGSRTLIIRTKVNRCRPCAGRRDVAAWVMACDNGHEWIPTPGTEIEIRWPVSAV